VGLIAKAVVAVMTATADPVNAVLKFIGLLGCAGISPADEHTISGLPRHPDDPAQQAL
tara:strand:+ start:766 stop:939 length:174 start_codon:yes stop_codon:yes gene_type:complete